MKTLVINLDKRPDRLSFITNELQGHGIEFERVAAVDGDLVDLNKLKESGFGLYNDWIDPMLFRGLTSGEIGCALSHIQCWNIATQLEEPVLILEDDVQVTEAPDFKEWETLSLAYDIIYLDHKEMLPEHTLTLNNRFQSICYPYWMSAYIIHHEFAKKLLTSGYLNNIIPVDELIPVLNSQRTISQDERVTKVFSDLRDKIRIDGGIKCLAYNNKPFKQLPRDVHGTNTEPPVRDSLTVHCVTIGTDEDKCKYLYNSVLANKLSIKNLGIGVDWEGGTMAGPGGGQKVNLVKDFIKDKEPDDIIIFFDGYDVVVNDSLQTIVERFFEFDCDLLFAAESNIWPDSRLRDQFDNLQPYPFLNSGCYIGRVGYLASIIDDYIPNSEDDQLFFQKKFLASDRDKFKLDHEHYIFSCLAGAEGDIRIQENGQLINVKSQACPCVLHGNGGNNTKSLYDSLVTKLGYHKHPQWLGYINNLRVTQEAPEILSMDMFTNDDCNRLVKLAEETGGFKPMEGDKFPAQEVRIRDIDVELFEEMENHFKKTWFKACEEYWWPMEMHGLRDAFIIKYSPETQASLMTHHDASLVSGIIKLNNNFEGGATAFPRQNWSTKESKKGRLYFWPGQVTHAHSGEEVTEGTKYALVLWTSRFPGDRNF